MAEKTSIGWTRSTWNPWIGCTRVSPGCDNCYAERMDRRGIFGGTTHWGVSVPRYRTSPENWNAVRRWNRAAAAAGEFWPVFTASMADVFDNEVPDSWRADFWALVRECTSLTFQILTKRIGNAQHMLPEDWEAGYPNVWLISSITTQAEADRDIAKLVRVPAAVHGLSMEPLLEAVNLPPGLLPYLGWVIVGGEYGPRPMDAEWARALLRQCVGHRIPFFMKQMGGPSNHRDTIGHIPADLFVRELPHVAR